MTDKNRTHEAQPLQRRHMPADYAISLAAYTGGGKVRIPDDFGPAQPMRGFEPAYRNIIDYIVRITYRIWEHRDVEYIRACYAPDCRVFDDYGLQRGSQKIVSDTRHTTGAFSDIRLIADDVIWAGDDEIGYHTSHRTLIRGTNDGDSKYGPATGKPVDLLVIANCVALGNDIFLEHVLYNTSSLLKQLGHDVEDQAARLAADPMPGWPRDGKTWTALRAAARPDTPISAADPVSGFDPDRFVREAFDRLWNKADYSVLSELYQPDFPFRGPTDRIFAGTAAYRGLLETIATAFPGLTLQVDEVYWMGNDEEGYAVSVRWSAEAVHAGGGLYGEPTGCRVQIWGITQQEIRGGRVTREWMLFNELDLMMQIAAARGR